MFLFIMLRRRDISHGALLCESRMDLDREDNGEGFHNTSQRLFDLSDDQTEYPIDDRMSFMRFLGLTLRDRAPEAERGLFRSVLIHTGNQESMLE